MGKAFNKFKRKTSFTRIPEHPWAYAQKKIKLARQTKESSL